MLLDLSVPLQTFFLSFGRSSSPMTHINGRCPEFSPWPTSPPSFSLDDLNRSLSRFQGPGCAKVAVPLCSPHTSLSSLKLVHSTVCRPTPPGISIALQNQHIQNGNADLSSETFFYILCFRHLCLFFLPLPASSQALDTSTS